MNKEKKGNQSDEKIDTKADILLYETKLKQCFYGRLLQLYEMKQAEAKYKGLLISRESLRTFLMKEAGVPESTISRWKGEYDRYRRLAHPQKDEEEITQEKSSQKESSEDRNDTFLQPECIDEIVIAFNRNAANETNMVDAEFLRKGPIVYKIKKLMEQFGLEYYDIFERRVMAEDKFNKLMSGNRMFTAKDVENIAKAFGVSAEGLLSCVNPDIGYGKSYHFTVPGKDDTPPTFLIGQCLAQKKQRESYKIITDILENKNFTLICSHTNLHWISHQTSAAKMNSYDDYDLTMEDAEKISKDVEKSKKYRTGSLDYISLKPYMSALIYKINCLRCCILIRSKENLWVLMSVET